MNTRPRSDRPTYVIQPQPVALPASTKAIPTSSTNITRDPSPSFSDGDYDSGPSTHRKNSSARARGKGVSKAPAKKKAKLSKKQKEERRWMENDGWADQSGEMKQGKVQGDYEVVSLVLKTLKRPRDSCVSTL